jgi:hypothetical protein
VAFLIVAVSVVGVMCATGVSRVGGELIVQERARLAADCAALGGISDIDSAEPIAIANGAELTELDDQRLTDGTVEVVVSMGDATSTAVAFDTWFDITPTLEP